MQLKIWHKMIIGISIPSLIAVLGVLLTYGYINDVEKRQSFVLLADTLKEQTIEVRRNEKTFLRYKNNDSRKNLLNSISALNNSINIISTAKSREIIKEDFPQLHNYIKTYLNTIDNLYENHMNEIKITEKVMAEGVLEKRLRDTGRELERITAGIDSREREKIISFITLTKRLLIAALVLFFISGPLFVYKTANYIVTPIKRIDDITKKISEGDTDLRAPVKEKDETSALAVSFNKMLDHMHLTHQSLEKSMELLTEKQAQLVDSEKRASLGLLVSGVAHELNNPLNNISLIAEIMTENAADHLSTEELKDLNRVCL